MRPTHSIGTSEVFKNLTNEQGRVVISPSNSIKVEAPAGSGKTTLMMGYAAARPKARGLYLAFGKPTQMEAQEKLTALRVNTIAKTSHSLAWSFGALLDKAGKLRMPSLRSAVTANVLRVNYAIASAVNETLKNFMASVDERITEKHLPAEKDYPVVIRNGGQVIDGARAMWARMVNPSDPEVQATHDVYFKQWTMTKPKLPFDFILFDECQDANPLLAQLVNQQTHITRVYVGDPHQAIYGFRGAVNLMGALQAESSHVLTASFRFTQPIGLLATTFLKHWKGKQTPIVGKGKGGPLLDSDQTAYLSRTTAGLIAKGFDLHSKGHRLHWIKGFNDYKVDPIMEAYRLFKGDRTNINDPVLQLMSSWEQFGDYVESTRDGEAGPVFRLVSKYKDEIPAIIEALRRNEVKKEKDAPYVLTTAHKSKGLEWPIVRLAEDYFSFKDDKDGSKWKSPKEIDVQEANLMYVALTRAQKGIAPNKEISEWFAAQPETAHLFEKPEDKDINKTEAPLPQSA